MPGLDRLDVAHFQMLGLLPAQQKSLLLEQRQAAVQESASPTFSPVHPSAVRQSAPSAPAKPLAPSLFARSLGAQPLGGALWPQSQNLAHPQGPAGSGLLPAQFSRASLEPDFAPGTDEGHRQIFGEQSFVPAHSQSQPLSRHTSTQQHQYLDQQQQLHHKQHQRLEHQLPEQHQQHRDWQQQQHLHRHQQQNQHPDRQQQQPFSIHRHQQQSQQHPHPDLQQLQQQFSHQQQQQSHRLSQEHAHRQSQSRPPPNLVPFEAQVRARLSWEEEGEEGGRKEVSSGQDREEEQEEEEEEEELEVTVKVSAIVG